MAKRDVLLAYDVDDVGGLDKVMSDWGYAYLSPKFDGYRAVTRLGEPILCSSQGNPFPTKSDWQREFQVFWDHVADILSTKMFRLDGELWMGHGTLQRLGSVAKTQTPVQGWDDTFYCCFDIIPGPGCQRMNAYKVNEVWQEVLRTQIAAPMLFGGPVHMVQHKVVRSAEEVRECFQQTIAAGGEGVMLRHPHLVWEAKRSRMLVKVKPERDAEGEIVGYEPGKGRLTGMLGSLIVKLPNGRTFGLAGLSDQQRSAGWEGRFPIGKVVTFKYVSLTQDGIPREARFFRMREQGL